MEEEDHEKETERKARIWTDGDLKETGNRFTFTTHFALRLTFGRGADVSPSL